ncbi:MAG: GDP-mannose 4,6-dehydratase [Planctomycetes bacterium]|nr:GDP-mannose 4,6-dehydratase [Planctomycetota bacterium]
MNQDERRILVTGGAGFIGSNFVNFVMSQRPNWRIVNLDALTYAGNLENLKEIADNPHYEFVHGDIRDRQAVVKAMTGCDSVVHFAAESHVDRSIADASPFVSTNVLGTQVMLDACREVGSIERFVHIGTDEVYGELPLDRPDLLFLNGTLVSRLPGMQHSRVRRGSVAEDQVN